MKPSFVSICMSVAALAVAPFCAAADGAAWSYAGPNGPPKWGKLDKSYATCATGTAQSPIDIPDSAARKGDLPPLLFNYKPAPLRIVDNGHTIQVNYGGDSWMTLAGKRYDLVYIEFHKPAEMKIDGKTYDMSAHLVHKDKDGKLAIVAVPLAQGKESAAIKTLWSSFPMVKDKESTVADVQIAASGLLPQNKDYYSFAGSLTTPPCTENVTWIVLKTPTTISAEQIARFGRAYPANARPVQPVNGRDIVGSV